MTETTIDIGALELDCGVTLPAVQQHVTIDGTPARDGENVVFAAHALTGSSRVAEWWPHIAGEGALFDRRYWCIIGINVLGGCYGSTGALCTLSLSKGASPCATSCARSSACSIDSKFHGSRSSSAARLAACRRCNGP